MPKEIIHTDQAPQAIGPYSQAVKVGPLLFVSGQLPIDMSKGVVPSGSVTRHTELALENLKTVVTAAGATMEQVVKVTVFMSDLEDFKFMNAAYEKFFPESSPARTTVEAKPPKGAKVEIDAMVVIG